MKKILSILAGIGLVLSVHATGSVGPNPPQSGVSTFTGLIQTNLITFAYPFQSVPIFQSYYIQGPTNAIPITNLLITTSNATIEIATAPGTGTNTLIAWNAFVGGTRLESGTNAATAQVPLLITFPYIYAVPPTVVASGNSTNTLSVGVSGITISNFTAVSPGATMVSWISVGTVANPPSPYTGTFPLQNTVVY